MAQGKPSVRFRARHRVGGVLDAIGQNVAAPATDDETGNPWMTHAERLIRSRAKLELALHVLKDETLAGTMKAAVSEAWDQLKSRTSQITQVGQGKIRAMEF